MSFLPLSSGVHADDPPVIQELLGGPQVSSPDSTFSPRQGKLFLNPQKRCLWVARGLSASFAGSLQTVPLHCKCTTHSLLPQYCQVLSLNLSLLVSHPRE